MTKNNGITVNQSGGTSSVGAISQGDHNTITSTAHFTGDVPEGAFNDFYEALEEARAQAGVSQREAAELAAKVVALEEQMKQKGPLEKISAFAKKIYDNYGWAAKPLRQLLRVVGV